MRARILGALEGKLPHDRAALKTHEIILEVEPSLIRSQSCAQPIICRRQHSGTDAEAAAEVGGDGGESLALPQPTGALDMNRQVAIAKAEPILAAERRERFHERPGLVPPTPSQLRVVEASKRVHQRVGVRRDMQAEMLEIIADIGDDEQIVLGFTIRLRPSASLAPPIPPDRATTRSRLIETDPHLGDERCWPPSIQERTSLSPRIRTAGSASSAWPITSEAAAATSSAKPMTLTSSLRPNRSGRPRRSISAGRPATPIATLGGSLAPGTPETVVYDHRDIDPGQRRQPAAQRLRAPIRILRQQKHAMGAVCGRHVRLVHPGIRHDEAEPVFNDQHAAARSHDTNRLRKNDLHKPRVLVDIRRKRDSPRGGFDRREVDDATLGLRDDFLRNDKHVSGARRDAVQLEG